MIFIKKYVLNRYSGFVDNIYGIGVLDDEEEEILTDVEKALSEIRGKYLIFEQMMRDYIWDNLYVSALENGGVDNWDWYDESIGDFVYNYCSEESIEDENVKYLEDLVPHELEKHYIDCKIK